MRKYNIEYWLSKNFKNTECITFLNYIISKHEKLFSLIDWSDESYKKNMFGVYINYYTDYPNSRDIKVNVIPKNNSEYGYLNIEIKDNSNTVSIVDNIHTNKNHYSQKTKVSNITHNADGTVVVKHTDYLYFNTDNRTVLNHDRLILDSDGSVIDYHNYMNETPFIRSSKALKDITINNDNKSKIISKKQNETYQ